MALKHPELYTMMRITREQNEKIAELQQHLRLRSREAVLDLLLKQIQDADFEIQLVSVRQEKK